MSGRIRVYSFSLVCSVVLLLGIASAAEAVTVTLGPADVSSSDALSFVNCIATPCTGSGSHSAFATQLSDGTAAAPADGTITTWRVYGTASGDGAMSLASMVGLGDGTFAAITTPVGPLQNVTAPQVVTGLTLPILYGGYPAISWSRNTGSVVVGGDSTHHGDYDTFTPAVTAMTPAGPTAVTDVAEPQFNVDVVLSVPEVDSLSASAGSPGDSVTIAGQHLRGATGVSFGSASASFTPVSDVIGSNPEHITAQVPSGVHGTVDVTVTGPGGTSAIGPQDQFTLPPAPAGAPSPGSSGSPTGQQGVSSKKCKKKHKRSATAAKAKCKKKRK